MGALAGIRVLDLGGSPAAELCGALLADQGADVVAVRPAGPHPVRDRGKRWLGALPAPARLGALLRGAHAVIDGRSGAAAVTDAAAWRRAHPALIVCRVPALPAGHPQAEAGVDPQRVDALAGLHTPPIGAPIAQPFALATTLAATWAALALVACRIAVERGEPGRAVEVPMLDAALSAQELAALLAVHPPRRWASLQWAGTPLVGAYRCADDRWLYLHAGLAHHLDRLIGALRAAGCDRAALALRRAISEPTRQDPMRFGSVREAARVRRLLRELFAERPADAWVEALAPAGLCVVPCLSAAEWREHPQPWADAQWVRLDLPEAPVQPGVGARLTVDRGQARPARPVPPSAVRWSRVPAPPGPAARAPLAGIRVLDATQVIAGPLAARALVLLGAEVVKVVNPRNPAAWSEAFATLFDAGKVPVRLDLTAADGPVRLRRLLTAWRPDLVLHNLLPPAASRLGLGVPELRRCGPRVLVGRVTAWGTDGPWAGRPGWEQTAQAATGAQLAYGGDHPSLVPVPATDTTTGLTLAFGLVCALRARERDGRVQEVDVALSHAASALQADPPGDPGPPVRLAAALELRPHLRRVGRAPWGGPFTEVGAPWRGPGLAIFPEPPGPSASEALAAAALTPDPAPAPTEAPLAGWLATQARWAAWVAWVRARP